MWRRTVGSLSGWVAFTGSLIFYARSLSPGVEFWDTGEMQTVPVALFIAHPTGFPFYVLCGWAFVHLVPVGDPAWRLSLFSALCVAGAAGLLAVFVRRLTGDGLAAVSAGLAFATVGVVWRTAERADVHDLTLLCTALALVFAQASTPADPRPLFAAALAWGAALATHPVALFAFPALIALAWPALLACGYGRLAVLAATVGAPLAAYAYVPLRSFAIERDGLDPNEALGIRGSGLVDDGAPATPVAFVRYVLGARFSPGDALAAFGRGDGAKHAADFAHLLFYGHYSYLALAFALLGVGVLARTGPRAAIALATLALGGIAFAANYAAESAPDRYALGACWAISAALAYGAWWFATSLVGAPRFARIAAVLLVVASSAPSYATAATLVRYRAQRSDAREEAPEIVRRTADGSVVVASWSFATPLAYAKYVTGTFGSRRVLSAWPGQYRASYASWRARFGHVYLVDAGDVGSSAPALGRVLFVAPARRYVLTEYAP